MIGRKRGRKTSSNLRVIALDPAPRPPVPAGFDAHEADTWRKLTGAQPADHLQPQHLPLLEILVRHVVAGRKISEMIAEVEASMAREEAEAGRHKGEERLRVILGATTTLDHLYKMRDREGRAASSLATRLRLTPQSMYDRVKPKGLASGTSVPWEGSPYARQLEEQRRDDPVNC